MSEPITLEQEKKAVKTIQKWAGAGEDAYKTVQKIEAAKLHGEVVELTKKEKSALVSGAVRMYLDGQISPKGKKILIDNNIDPEFLRRDVVEAAMPQALARIISEGDIERFVALGTLAGEKPEVDVPQGAKRFIRERVEIIIDD